MITITVKEDGAVKEVCVPYVGDRHVYKVQLWVEDYCRELGVEPLYYSLGNEIGQ